jgi:hypothetical protein
MRGMELLNIYRTHSLQEMMIYLIGKLNKIPNILTFGQFDHLAILDKLI